MSHVNPSRTTKLDDLASVQRTMRDWDLLAPSERNRQRLIELRKFVDLLEATEVGKRDLEQRRKRYGECVQEPDESASAYYGRLRVWLDRPI